MKNKKLIFNAIAIIFIAINVLAWLFVVWQKNNNFTFDSGDTSVAEQAIWNFTHGNGFLQGSLLDESNLKEHLSFIQFIYVPFYWLIPHTLTLYFIIYLFFAVAGLCLFLYAKEKIGLFGAFVSLILFLCQPLTLIQTVGPMHVVAVSAPLLLISLILYEKKFYRSWLVFIFLTAFVSEFIAPTIFLISLVALLDRRSLKWILPPFLFSGTMYFISSYYITLGLSEKSQIIKKFNIQYILETIDQKRLKFIELNFFRPIFYLPIFISKYTLLLIPSLLLGLFIAERLETGAHIFAPAIAILTMIFIDFTLKVKNKKHQYALFLVVLSSTLFSFFNCSSYFDIPPSNNKQEFLKAVALIKDDGSVTAIRSVGHFVNKRKEFYLPDNKQLTDYIILKTNKNNTIDEYEQLIISSNDYLLVMHENKTKVYIKKQKISELLNIPVEKINIEHIKNLISLNNK